MLELLDPIPAEADSCPGALLTPRGAMPLTALSVRARIDGLIAETAVRQTFVNPLDEPLEAMYLFPLPDRAAVTRCRFEAGGRVTEADLQEKNQARETYQRAIRAGHRAAIAEEEKPGVFRLRVGNLPPGEAATVMLDLVGPVPLTDGEATFRFPLVIAPRYAPAGDPHAPPRLKGEAGVELSIEAEVSDALSPHGFRATMPTVNEETGVLRIAPGQKLDRDFVLRWRFGGDGVRTTLSLRKDDAGDEGTFLLTLVPPAVAGASRPREVVFVLDRSGSMGGWKMVAARRAVARMIETLTDRDRFAVYAFDDRIATPPGLDGTALVPATDRMRNRALDYLATVEAEGGTEMLEPLAKAAEQLARGKGDRVLVLITDGQVSNEEAILQTLGPALKGTRVFTLGIDQAVNAAFLSRLAALGGGRSEVVESEERLDAVMDQVHRLIGTPVWTHLRVEAPGVILDEVTPKRLPDVFAGAPVLIAGRYRGAVEGLTVRAAEGSMTVPARRASVALGPVWARGRIRDLEDAVVLAGDYEDRTRLERGIVRLSLAWRVLSRLTAYVAVDRAEAVNEGGRGVRVTPAVETPAGWEREEAALSRAMPMETESVDSMLAEFDDAEAGPPPAPAAIPAPMRRIAHMSMPRTKPRPAASPAKPGTVVGAIKSLLGLGEQKTEARRSAEEILRALEAETPSLGLLRRHQAALEAVGRAAGDVKLAACLVRLQQLPDGASEHDVRALYADLVAALRAWVGR